MSMENVITRDGLKMEADVNELAWQLVTYRARAGLTQRQLAELWGTSRYILMKIENAKVVGWPSMYRVASKLADALRKEGQQ